MPNSPLTFAHADDFDQNGLFYWIGTNAKMAVEWANPAQYGLVVVTSSEGRNLPYGKLEDILSRDAAALNCHTNDDREINSPPTQFVCNCSNLRYSSWVRVIDHLI